MGLSPHLAGVAQASLLCLDQASYHHECPPNDGRHASYHPFGKPVIYWDLLLDLKDHDFK